MKLTGCEGEVLRRLAEMPFLDRMELTAVSGWSKGAVYRSVRRLEEGGLAAPVPPRYGPHPADGEVPPHRRRSAPSGAMGRHERGRAASHPSRLRPVAAHPPGAPRRRRRRLPPRLRRLQHRLPHAVPVVQGRAHRRSHRALGRTDPRRSQAGTHRRQDGLLQAHMEAVGGAGPRRSPRARARRGAAETRPQAAHRRSRARHVGPGARRGPGRRRRARLASAVHRRGHRPGVGAGPDTAGRRSSGGTAALGSVPPLGHTRRPSRAGPSRPHAARPSQARREAHPRPALRLALDIAEGPGWPAGRLGAAGVPAGDSPRRLRPRGPPARRRDRRSRPGPTPGPHRRGAGGAGPQGPRLRGRGEEALERHPRRPGSPPLLAQRVGCGKQTASQEPGAHHGGARLHRGPGPAVPLPGLEAGPDRPAAKGVEVLPARRPCPRGRAGCRSVHPDAFGILRRGRTTWPFFLEWERRAVRPATMAERLAPYLRYYSSRRPLDDHGAQPAVLVVFDDDLAATHFLRVAREEMAQDPGPSPPVGLPQGQLSTPWGLWDGPGSLPAAGNRPTSSRCAEYPVRDGSGAAALAPS